MADSIYGTSSESGANRSFAVGDDIDIDTAGRSGGHKSVPNRPILELLYPFVLLGHAPAPPCNPDTASRRTASRRAPAA